MFIKKTIDDYVYYVQRKYVNVWKLNFYFLTVKKCVYNMSNIFILH